MGETKEKEKLTTPPEYHLPVFRVRIDINKEYDFDKRVVWLPFPFNLGDVPLTKEQQDWLINLVYDNQQVFSLHDEDLAYCDKLAHTILTTDKHVYLPHQMIPHQIIR